MLSETAGKVTSSIANGTHGVIADLKETGSSFGSSANKITAVLDSLEAGEEHYLKALSSLTETNEKLEVSLEAISSQMIAASGSVVSANETLNEGVRAVLKGLQEFTATASETNRVVQHSQEAVRSTVGDLREQMSQHIKRYNEVDDKLASVFTSISTHLELQSKQMAEQFAQMDQALAGAVNHFENLIDGLIEASSMRTAAE